MKECNKMDRRAFLKSGLIITALTAFSGVPIVSAFTQKNSLIDDTDKLPFKKIKKTDAEWKRILTPEQYAVTRQGATEAPYSSPLTDLHDKGTFLCVCCDLPLFSSANKFDSGTGWASFYAPIAKINIRKKVDRTLSEVRTEVLCNRCDAHLGHVFDDGPKPTGLRFCMNGVALKFQKK
jgi:peptide-methionine (R)-S-oxide reductase